MIIYKCHDQSSIQRENVIRNYRNYEPSWLSAFHHQHSKIVHYTAMIIYRHRSLRTNWIYNECRRKIQRSLDWLPIDLHIASMRDTTFFLRGLLFVGIILHVERYILSSRNGRKDRNLTVSKCVRVCVVSYVRTHARDVPF